jgi:hypothetical protein
MVEDQRVNSCFFNVGQSRSTLKPTKTNKLMLRCNNCTLLIFANGRLSQQKLLMLPNYQFGHHPLY